MTVLNFLGRALKRLFGQRSNSEHHTKIVNVINNQNNSQTTPRKRGSGQHSGGKLHRGNANYPRGTNPVPRKPSPNSRPGAGKNPPPINLQTNPNANTKPRTSRVEPSPATDSPSYFSKQGRYDHIQTEEELDRAFANDLLDGSSKFLTESHPLLRDDDDL